MTPFYIPRRNPHSIQLGGAAERDLVWAEQGREGSGGGDSESGDVDAGRSREEAHDDSGGGSASQLVWLTGGDWGLESGVDDGAVGQADSGGRGVLVELNLPRFGRGPVGRAE